MTDRAAESGSYHDSLISLRHGMMTIKRYYFPSGTKRIRLAQIRAVREYAMTRMSGKWRLWGSGNFVHWFNLDPNRRRKERAFVIDLGRRAKPVVTPDDPDAFRAAIVGSGIPLSDDVNRAGRR